MRYITYTDLLVLIAIDEAPKEIIFQGDTFKWNEGMGVYTPLLHHRIAKRLNMHQQAVLKIIGLPGEEYAE